MNKIIEIVSSHVNQCFQQLHSSNKLNIKVIHTGEWWLGDFMNKYYQAAAKSIEIEVFIY